MRVQLVDPPAYTPPYDHSLAAALARAGVLAAAEANQIQQGLTAVQAEFASGGFQFLPTDEDIHTVVERRNATSAASLDRARVSSAACNTSVVRGPR